MLLLLSAACYVRTNAIETNTRTMDMMDNFLFHSALYVFHTIYAWNVSVHDDDDIYLAPGVRI